MKGYCPYCAKEVEVQIKEQDEKITIVTRHGERGFCESPLDPIVVKRKHAYCSLCGQEIFVPEIHDENLKVEQDTLAKENIVTEELLKKFNQMWDKTLERKFGDHEE